MSSRTLGDYRDFDQLLIDLVDAGYCACTDGQPRGGQWEFFAANGATPPHDEVQIFPHVAGGFTGWVYACFAPDGPEPWALFGNDGGCTTPLDLGLTLGELPDACAHWMTTWEVTP